MARLEFAPSLQRYVPCPPLQAEATCLHEAMLQAWKIAPALRPYVLDEQGCVRRHVAVFINGQMLHDRTDLSRPLGATDSVYIAQALSGG
jgi:molybdopterin synthase sulfur carrier subunit